MFRAAMRMTHNCDDAEDVSQEAMLRLLQSRRQFASATQRRSWIMRVMSNVWIDSCRRQARDMRVQSYQSPRAVADATDVSMALKVRSAIDQLPSPQRMAVRAVVCGLEDASEVAAAAGVSEQCIYQRSRAGIFRLRARLRCEGEN